MTPTDFRAALAALGYSQAAFARFLTAHGHPATDVARSVRRWCQVGPPGEVVVILSLMRPLSRQTASEPPMDPELEADYRAWLKEEYGPKNLPAVLQMLGLAPKQKR